MRNDPKIPHLHVISPETMREIKEFYIDYNEKKIKLCGDTVIPIKECSGVPPGIIVAVDREKNCVGWINLNERRGTS